jgi:hypothetical protein
LLRHFRQRYCGDLRFESLLDNAVNIAPLRVAKRRSYWKRVFFYDYFHNFIAQLRSAPQENRYWKANSRAAIWVGPSAYNIKETLEVCADILLIAICTV